jgi:flagellar biosynthesis/type III secretory pathway protein FliH
MARIFKFVHAETADIARFDRDSLEEFPAEEILAPDFLPMDEEEVTDEEEAPPIDPEVIREEIMAAAREEAAQKVQEAYQEGLARGTQAGQERFDASLARCTEALDAAVAAIQTSHDQFLNSLEPQVVALVKLMATRVIETELRTGPEAIQNMARRALSKLAGQFAVTLLVHPDDLEALKAHEVSLLDSVAGVDSLQIQASEDVEPGGCIAQSADMEVDARLETLLSQVLNALTE